MWRREEQKGVLTAIQNFTNYRQHNTWKKQPLLHSTDIIFVLYVTQWFLPKSLKKITVLLTYELCSSVSESKDETFLL
jgi:hypothetical protein